MGCGKSREYRREAKRSRGFQRADSERSGRRAVVQRRTPCFLKKLRRAECIGKQPVAGGCGFDPPGVPPEQRRAEFLFQPAYACGVNTG